VSGGLKINRRWKLVRRLSDNVLAYTNYRTPMKYDSVNMLPNYLSVNPGVAQCDLNYFSYRTKPAPKKFRFKRLPYLIRVTNIFYWTTPRPQR